MDFERKYLESHKNIEEKTQNAELDFNDVKEMDWENEQEMETKKEELNIKNNEEGELYDNDDDFLQNSKYYEKMYLNQGKANNNFISYKENKHPNFPRGDICSIPLKAPVSTSQINTLPEIESNPSSVKHSHKPLGLKQPSNSITVNTLGPLTSSNEFSPKEDKKILIIPEGREEELMRMEDEIKENARREFEEAIIKLKDDMNKTLENERKKMEEEISRRWSEQYDNLVLEIKTRMREEKEKKLHQNMYNKLKPNIEQQIYKNEYPKIEEKIRNELTEKITAEMKERKLMEIERLKKKFELESKCKLEEVEINYKKKHEEDLNELVKKEVAKKEKEIHATHLKKFNNLKIKLETQLKQEYDMKREELMAEVKEMKSNMYRQKCAEKLKMNQINKIKKTILSREKTQLENVERLEKVLTKGDNQNFYKPYFSDKENNDKNNSKNLNNILIDNEGLNDSGNAINLSRVMKRQNSSKNAIPNQEVSPMKSFNKEEIYNNLSDKREIVYEVNSNSEIKNMNEFSNFSETSISTNNPYKKIIPSNSKSKLKTISEEETLQKNMELCRKDIKSSHRENTLYQNVSIPQPRPNSINLLEINKKIKPFSPQPKNLESNEAKLEYKNTNLIENKPCSTLKEDFNKIIMKNLYNDSRFIEASHNHIIEKAHDSSKGNTTNNSFNSGKLKSPRKDMLQEIPEKLNSIEIVKLDKICQSLKVSEVMPMGMIEFGKFLINHIEKEENYRILLEKEFKKMKVKIKKIFDEEKSSDHCLLDYMIELWDKLEISNERRYRILSDLSNQKATIIYNFLDKETELLTESYKNSNNVVTLIKNREKLKSKLQQKSNRNELLKEDKEKFYSVTQEITKKIKIFKSSFNQDIVWKGLFYEWLINYENWFYENSNQN